MEDKQLENIERYLKGKMKKQESEEFQQQLDKDNDLASEVEQHRQTNAAANAYFEQKMMEQMMAKGKKMLQEKRHQSTLSVEQGHEAADSSSNVISIDRANRKSRRTWLSIAASLLIIVSVAGWQLGWLNTGGPDQVAVIEGFYSADDLSNTGLLSQNDNAANLNQAISAFRDGDYTTALSGFNSLLANPDFEQKPRLQLLSGIAYSQLGEVNSAIQQFEAIPSSARTYFLEGQWQLAFTHWKAGNFEQAQQVWMSIASNQAHPKQSQAQEILDTF